MLPDVGDLFKYFNFSWKLFYWKSLSWCGMEGVQNFHLFSCKTDFELFYLCVRAEVLNKDVLKDFLARYGKAVDQKKEDTRSGMSHKMFRLAIIKEYDLLITPERFTEEIRPMYRERWVLISLSLPVLMVGLYLVH